MAAKTFIKVDNKKTLKYLSKTFIDCGLPFEVGNGEQGMFGVFDEEGLKLVFDAYEWKLPGIRPILEEIFDRAMAELKAEHEPMGHFLRGKQELLPANSASLVPGVRVGIEFKNMSTPALVGDVMWVGDGRVKILPSSLATPNGLVSPDPVMVHVDTIAAVFFAPAGYRS